MLRRVPNLLILAAMVAGLPSLTPLSAQTYEEVYELTHQPPEALETACQDGKEAECFALAIQYSAGFDVEADEARALLLAERSCDLGLAVGCTGVGELKSVGAGQDPQVAEYFYSGCSLGDSDGCRFAVPYALGENHALTGLDRRIEVGQRACRAGHRTGCFLLNELGVEPQMKTNPHRMNVDDMRFYVQQTGDYVTIANYLARRYPQGIANDSRNIEKGVFLAEMIEDMGPEQYARLSRSAHRSLGTRSYWPSGTYNTARQMAWDEYRRLREAEQAEARARIEAEAALWPARRPDPPRRAYQPYRPSDSGSTSSSYTPPSSQICYWVSNPGIGGGNYRKCE